MKSDYRRILLKSVEVRLRNFQHSKHQPAPRGGWLRAIRVAVGMPVKYLANKLGVTPSAILDLEKNETSGTVTLNSLKRAADAMDCELVYALVPRSGSLHAMLNKQALKRAQNVLLPVAHSMLLEHQETAEPGKNVKELARQLAATIGPQLWREE